MLDGVNNAALTDRWVRTWLVPAPLSMHETMIMLQSGLTEAELDMIPFFHPVFDAGLLKFWPRHVRSWSKEECREECAKRAIFCGSADLASLLSHLSQKYERECYPPQFLVATEHFPVHA